MKSAGLVPPPYSHINPNTNPIHGPLDRQSLFADSNTNRNEPANGQSITRVVFQIESRSAWVVYGSVINEGCLKIC